MKKGIIIHCNHIKLRQNNDCCHLKIFIHKKVFAFGRCNHRFGSNSGEYLTALLFEVCHWKMFHPTPVSVQESGQLTLNVQNGGVGLSGKMDRVYVSPKISDVCQTRNSVLHAFKLFIQSQQNKRTTTHTHTCPKTNHLIHLKAMRHCFLVLALRWYVVLKDFKIECSSTDIHLKLFSVFPPVHQRRNISSRTLPTVVRVFIKNKPEAPLFFPALVLKLKVSPCWL